MTAFFADPLRLALLAAGVALVVGIYFYAKTSVRRAAPFTEEGEAKPAPQSQDIYKMLYDPEIDGDLGVVLKETRNVERQPGPPPEASVAAGQQVAPVADSRLVVLYVMAPDGQAFEGEQILPVFAECRLTYGQRKIFHYAAPGGEKVFSLANMVEPGFLDIQEQTGFTTRGLVIFMSLPGPMDGPDAFARMVATAERIAARLGGEVFDETFKPLSREAAARIHDELTGKPAPERQRTASLV